MAEQWYYAKGGQQLGPVNAEGLKQLAAAGQLQPSDLVWREGMAAWAQASTIRGLFTQNAPAGSSSPQPMASVQLPAQPLHTQAVSTGTKTKKPSWLLIAMGIGGGVLLLCCGGPMVFLAGLSDTQHRSEQKKASKAPASATTTEDTSERRATRTGHADDENNKSKHLGTMQEMGQRFYDKLAFAEVSKGEELHDVALTTEFCPSGRRKYRRVTFDISLDRMNRSGREQLSSLGYKRTDSVDEGVEVKSYEVTPGEPKNVYAADDKNLLPLLRLGATPGDEWEWDLPRLPNGDKWRYVFKYTRAVRLRGRECVCVVQEAHVTSGSIVNNTLERMENWYAKGIGLVKQDQYVNVGVSDPGLTHLGVTHCVME